ncbi:family 78 glycoside hydrolase catalytic domain [Deinococcus aestuarii]|uniref:family 78 glycoside hydrolase catalytic domain n=1 Tax=Deinococcus aestuarii TaxID=2774531 RepID=UPI001C0AFE09|nr:family 78 glycoside hydrolase catalytic domain [Deinococcus aestuarii]
MSVTPAGLRCESLAGPLGLGERRPRLSWVLRADRRGVTQTAYEVFVAEDEADLTPEKALWNTGRVASAQSAHVRYDGPPLESRQRYVWKVRVWDENGDTSDWSEPGFWEMGLLNAEDWQARWVEPRQEPVTPEPPVGFFAAMGMKPRTLEEMRALPETLHPCPRLRKTFEVPGPVGRARLYATAHGLYTLHLNGERVGDRELTPENTSYPQYLMVQPYDVTGQVRVGENALGITLADGWYAGRTSATGDSLNFGDRLAVLFQLELELEDGTRLTVTSDGDMRSSLEGPFVYSDLFIGERYDARREQPGWSAPGFDDSAWSPVTLADHGYGNLVPQYGEPVRAVMTLPAVQVLTTPAGETVVDFGQVIAGRVRMTARGPAGTEVFLQHGEVLDEHGNFFQNITWRNKDQTDVYVLRGAEEETYEPTFTFHGFRYVKVMGSPGEVCPEDFTAVVLASDLPPAGTFETSDPRLNQLQSNIVWSQRGNFLSIPTDCPQRERTGWTGDIQAFAPTAVFNMGAQAFLTRWLRNVQREQLPDGQIPHFVPTTPRMQDPFGGRSSAGWGDACIIVPWVLYQDYADEGVLAENYPTMQRWLAYIEREAANGLPEGVTAEGLSPAERERQRYLWNTGFHFGDWLIPSIPNPGEGAFATKELVATCFYAYSAGLLAQVAGVLGKEEDAERYAELNCRVRRAFAEEYLSEDGRLRAHFQGVYVLALHLNMVPEERCPQVLGQLVGLIEANGDRLDTGFASVPFLLDVLSNHGRADVAYRLLFQTGCPSWLYEVERGATTIWESWRAITPDGGVNAGSYNHYAFGCVGDWMYRTLGGLQRLEPGYRHFAVRPDFGCGLTSARTAHDTVYGPAAVQWSRDGDRVTLCVTVPAGTRATVHLPGPAERVRLDGGELTDGEGVLAVETQEGEVRVTVGSGTSTFTAVLPDRRQVVASRTADPMS